tara:strand:+ start:64 stop:276 length:213 start_codon:yes stop_codon:yes gene_type:complete
MEEKLNKLISYCRQIDNVYLKNELKDLKTKMETTASFLNYLRIEAMEKRIKELEQENELLTSKLQVYGQN